MDKTNLAGVLILETEMARKLKHLSPAFLVYNRNTGEVSDEIGIHKSLSITWNRFLEEV